jgi:hypothetical protein
VLKWPDATTVADAVARWAHAAAVGRDDVIAIGYFGSYATGRWGVGSDLDLVAIVRDSELPIERRSVSWDATTLPVPADLLVYTVAEWRALLTRGDRFARVMRDDVVWVQGRPPGASAT